MIRRISRTRVWLGLPIVALVTGLGLAPIANATGEAVCSGVAGTGDWPMYGHDLHGTGHGDAAGAPTTENVADLGIAWLSTVPTGPMRPVVAGGCVYVTGGQTLSAVSLQDGSTVWQVQMPGGAYAVAVANGRVHAGIQTGAGSSAVSYDAATGGDQRQGEVVSGFGGPRASVISSAVVWDGKQLVPTTGPDGNPFARPGIIVYDADDMSTLSKHTTIPEEDLNKGYAGGGIWSTPVVDEETGYAYAGTANPASKQLEHAYDNAIVKIDLRGRPATNPTFGRVVGSYKGIPDSPEGTTNTAACDLFGDTLENPSWSVTCVQYDIDFAASPILYRRSSTGRTTVAESQKASVLHAVDAETMEPIWTYRMGPTIGYFAGGAGSSSTPAFDGQRFFINNPYTGVEAIGADTGVKIWTFAGEAGGRLHARPVSVANGVVYVVGQSSEIFALDAETGTPLWVSQAHKDAISAGAGPTQCTPSGPLGGGGTAIAHGTFLVNCDGALLAYRVQS